MRGLWPWSGCVGSLVTILFTQLASGMEVGDGGYEVDWVEKVHHTLEIMKRKQTCPLSGYSLCPSSVGGGCCPEDYECGTSLCSATTAGPSACHGKPGWYSCDPTIAAGLCCPDGSVCDQGGGCKAPPGLSISMTCDNNGIRCPFTLGGGCCRESQVCGANVCYDTTPKTGTVSETTTITNSRGSTITTVVTSLTTYTDGPDVPSGLPSATGETQVFASVFPKIKLDGDDDDDKGNGLSSGALGGIIAIVVVILIAIVVATIFIIRRLKKTEKTVKLAEKAAADRKHESSNSQTHSNKSNYHVNISEIGSNTDTDPAHEFPIMRHSTYSPRSRSTTIGTDRTPSNTPNFTNSAASSPPPPHGGNSAAAPYAPSRPSESRQSSFDSYAHHGTTTPDNNNMRISQRVSVDSAAHTYAHSRNHSDASELEAPRGVVELQSENTRELEAARRRSESLTRPGGGGGAKAAAQHVRRNSDQNRARGDSAAGASVLGTVNEAFEMHGHYGPSNAAVGQTLGGGGSSPTTSSP